MTLLAVMWTWAWVCVCGRVCRDKRGNTAQHGSGSGSGRVGRKGGEGGCRWWEGRRKGLYE